MVEGQGLQPCTVCSVNAVYLPAPELLGFQAPTCAQPASLYAVERSIIPLPSKLMGAETPTIPSGLVGSRLRARISLTTSAPASLSAAGSCKRNVFRPAKLVGGWPDSHYSTNPSFAAAWLLPQQSSEPNGQ